MGELEQLLVEPHDRGLVNEDALRDVLRELLDGHPLTVPMLQHVFGVGGGVAAPSTKAQSLHRRPVAVGGPCWCRKRCGSARRQPTDNERMALRQRGLYADDLVAPRGIGSAPSYPWHGCEGGLGGV